MTLGDVISEYRKEHGISMDRFAELSGISKAYISILERNKTPRGDEPSPSFEKYRDVAKAIGMDVDDLIRKVDGKISLIPANNSSTESPSPSIPGILPLPAGRSYPLVGEIACGTPILADENVSEYVQFPGDLDADFCLRCRGDSMVDARILDGDVVFIRKQPEVANGEIAAVLIDGEATLKRVYRSADALTLVAANASYAPMVYTGSQLAAVTILGKAVAFLSSVK